MNKIEKITISIALSSLVLVGCGSSNTGNEKEHQNNNNNEGSESYIPYLKQNHANYSQDGSAMTPAPTKDVNAKSIDWTISANSNEGAENLAKHIRFMIQKLENDENPRAFDKLFLMEAYMKYNHFYTTTVEQSGTSVVVSKNATTACAYEVISAHSNAVSGDFFAQGVINNDYSSTAEAILASSACNDVRSSVENYISQRQRERQ